MRLSMVRSWILLLAVSSLLLTTRSSAAAAAGPPGAPSTPVPLTPADLAAFVDQVVQEGMAAAHVPGLVVTVVYRDQIVLARGYGLADLATNRPMTPQTPIRAGSVSKPVTSAAVLQLSARDVIDLHRPLSDYITDLPLTDRYGPAATVAQSLTLKGGYPDAVVQTHAADLATWQPLDQYLAGHLPARVLPPGKVHSYNSWDHALLGYMMAQVTGQSFDQAMAAQVFQPLGMDSSTFTQPLPEPVARELAAGYRYVQGQYEPVPLDYVQLSPGIALVTTGADMGRFMLAILNDGRLNGAQALHPAVSQGLLQRQEPVHVRSRGRTYGLSEVTLGGRQVLYQDGNGIGFGNRLILAPAQRLGIFLAVNHRPLAPDISDTAAYGFMKAVGTAVLERYLPPTPPAPAPALQPLPDAAARAARYAGHYRLAGTPQQDFFKLGALLDSVDVGDNGDGTVTIGSGRYQEVEPLLFQSMSDPGFFVVFAADNAGQAQWLTFGGTNSYARVNWYETPGFQLGLVATMLLVFLSFLVLMPFSRYRTWPVWILSLINVLFLAGLAVMMTRSDLVLFFKTIPPGTRLLFLLPRVSGLLTLLLPLFLVGLWRRRVSVPARLHIILAGLAAVALLWFVLFWRLTL